MLQNACCFVLLFTLCAAVTGPQDLNVTLYKPVLRNGRTMYMKEDLLMKLEEESETWHWTPYLKTKTRQEGRFIYELECTTTRSLDSFPAGIFTEEQLRQGAVVCYILFAMCCFTLIAFVCNDYFLPSVEIICVKLKIPQNVAAATFMSVATSCPEFFVNVVSTFLTGSDMGIGTIVGSAIFNALGVAAIGGIAAIKPIPIERRPVTRDVIIYMVNVSVLVAIVWNGEITWYEATVLAVLYVLYFVIMFNSRTVFLIYDKLAALICRCNSSALLNESATATATGNDVVGSQYNAALEPDKRIESSITKPDILVNGLESVKKVSVVSEKLEDAGPEDSIWRYPSEKSVWLQGWFILSWPLRFVLFITIPDPQKYERLYVVSFIMCIVWIGVNSYLVSWSMTVIGYTFDIPDSVMGMTFMAFGGCLPEACAIFIMSRRGEGGIGVSNALGANSLAILFALGLPWLIRTLALVTSGAEYPVVTLNSAGIDFVVGSLLVAVAALWLTLFFGKFTLRRSVGAVLLCLYVIFVTVAILVETGLIVNNSLPFC